MRTKPGLCVSVSILLLAVPRAWGVSGDLDPTFGVNGVATVAFDKVHSYVRSIVRQADGGLLVGGAAGDAIAVARLDQSGVLDGGFGVGGTVITDVGPFSDYAVQVMLQSDGKIVVAGASGTESSVVSDIVLVRYEADGTLDATFGDGGVVTTPLAVVTDTIPQAAALQADGKVIVAGGRFPLAGGNAPGTDGFVARYESSGALDTSFGSSGFVTLDFGGKGDVVGSVVVQPDGYIVVATTSYHGSSDADGSTATLARLDPYGTLDPAFGTGGVVTESGANRNLFRSLLRQDDGHLVVYGASGPLAIVPRLYRYDSTGTPDGGFAGDPLSLWLRQFSPSALGIGTGGELVAIGDAFSDGYSVVRVQPDGSVDTGFGVDGYASPGIGAVGAARSTLIEPSGDILLAGHAEVLVAPHTYTSVMAVVRVLGSSPPCISDADCGACERCDTGFCARGSRDGCAVALPGAARLRIKNKSALGKSKLVVKWAGTVPSFDPSLADDVALCAFYGGERIVKAVAPAGGTCGTTPCWSGTAPDFAYRDSEGTPDGVRRIKASGTRFQASAAGPQLDWSSEGVPRIGDDISASGPPVLLQVQAGAGACLDATFTTGRRTTRSLFTGRSD